MKQPHNPGMSPEAWKKLHEFIAEKDLKYGISAKLSAKKAASKQKGETA